MLQLLGEMQHEQVTIAKFTALRNDLLNCQACSARWEASKPVPPIGSLSAKIMVVGRNPGTQEDMTGRPFHPDAPGGSELAWYLRTAGVDSEHCFITNCVNCHTWMDREPTEQEVSTCTIIHLGQFIDLIKPRVIIACGRIAVEHLTGSTESLLSHNSQPVRTRHGVIFPIPHPAVVCYDPRRRGMMKYSAALLRRFLQQCCERFGGDFFGEAFKHGRHISSNSRRAR